FGRALVAAAAHYPALVVLDADVAGGTGTHHFRRAYPHRFVQVGIAEQNMAGIAAGMALAGCLPVASTFAVFALRTIEQVRQSIAYPRLNVKLAASHPGLDTGAFVTAEDHNIVGGLGGAVAEALARTVPTPVEFVGVRDLFGESGEPDELAAKYGLTAPAIAEAARRAVVRKGQSR